MLCRLADLVLQKQAQLVDAGHRRVRSLGELERVAIEVIEVAVRDEEDVAALLLIDGPGALGIAEPRIDEDYLPARGLDLDTGVAEPSEEGVAIYRHHKPPAGRGI
jgi:hypothetical protein